jgi:hypothetical protein
LRVPRRIFGAEGHEVLPLVCVVAVPRRLEVKRDGVTAIRSYGDRITRLDAALRISPLIDCYARVHTGARICDHPHDSDRDHPCRSVLEHVCNPSVGQTAANIDQEKCYWLALWKPLDCTSSGDMPTALHVLEFVGGRRWCPWERGSNAEARLCARNGLGNGEEMHRASASVDRL